MSIYVLIYNQIYTFHLKNFCGHSLKKMCYQKRTARAKNERNLKKLQSTRDEIKYSIVMK